MDISNCKKIGEIINRIIDTLGVEIALKDSKKFKALFSDLAPEMYEERNIFNRVLDDETISLFYHLKNEPVDGINSAVLEIQYKLINFYGISEIWTKTIILGFLFACEYEEFSPYKKDESSDSKLGSKCALDDNSNIAPLLRRAFMFLEDGEFEKADQYCERVLDVEPENAKAYLVKLLVELELFNPKQLGDCLESFESNPYYMKSKRFADKELGLFLDECVENSNARRLEETYQNTCREMLRATKELDFINISRKFQGLKGYKDSALLFEECINKAQIAKKNDIYSNALKVYKSARNQGNTQKRIVETESAIHLLESIEEWKDSSKLISKWKIDISSDKIKLDKEKELVDSRRIIAIDIGTSTLGLRKNGTVVATGSNKFGQINVSGWTDIIAISVGSRHSVGLKKDGTVVATGSNEDGQCNVSGWTDIISVSAGSKCTFGLKKDGTVISTIIDKRVLKKLAKWKDVKAIRANDLFFVGLLGDGSVIIEPQRRVVKGICYDLSAWKDIVAISTNCQSKDILGLKKDGSVLRADNYYKDLQKVTSWNGIVALSFGVNHAVGLKKDGTVVAAGKESFGNCDVSGWKDIVAISTGFRHTVGLKSDGTILSVGDDRFGDRDFKNWN